MALAFLCSAIIVRTRLWTRKRNYLRAVEKRPHAFFGYGPFELGIGGLIGREEIVPDDGRIRVIDHFERPLTFVLKPMIETFTVIPSLVTRRDNGESMIFGSCSIIAASSNHPSLFALGRPYQGLAGVRSLRAILRLLRSPNMRPKRPTHVSIDQVRVTREGNAASIDHADASAPNVHLTIGPGIELMSDADIVAMYNDILDAQWALLQDWDKTVVEEPPGEPQNDYHECSDQWVPRGDVLRCIVDDGGPDGEVTIHIDDGELSLAEFGRLLKVHAGWGMGIAFVPEEFATENPKVKVRKPKGRKR